VFIRQFPHAAGSAHAFRDENGSKYPRPARSVFMHYQNPNWNPYIPFATAEEWKTVALATQHRFGRELLTTGSKAPYGKWRVFSQQSTCGSS
jgi:hypothetical protein